MTLRSRILVLGSADAAFSPRSGGPIGGGSFRAPSLLGPQRLIGLYTTNPEKMQRAIAEGADYMGVDPVYSTPTKQGKVPAGLAYYVRYASEHSSVPWFAIGGIDGWWRWGTPGKFSIGNFGRKLRCSRAIA